MKRALLSALLCTVAMPALAQQQVPALSATAHAEASLPSDGSIAVNGADGSKIAPGPISFPPQAEVGPAPTPMNAKERRALKLAKARINNRLMPVADDSGVVRYAYGYAEPSMICAPGKWCIIQLEAGEIITGGNGQQGAVELTDKANWAARPIVYGSGKNAISAVAVSPRYPGTQAMVIIGTNKGRIYQVSLRSMKTEWIPKIGFSYPDDEAKRAQAAYQQAVQETAYQAPQDIAATIYDFEIEGYAPWRPEQVYSDGQRTVIVFPEGIAELPTVVGLSGGSWFSDPKQIVLNSQMIAPNRMLVDSVLERAALISGVGSEQISIEISRRS